MNEKITLRFQKLHLVTTLGWALILVLSLLSRGVLSDFVFWLLFIMISILFFLDAIYFVTRVIDGHYLLITNQEVLLKRLFQPIDTIKISNLQSIIYINKGNHSDKIILQDDDHEMEIIHHYKFTKESILRSIQQSNNFPKNIKVIRK